MPGPTIDVYAGRSVPDAVHDVRERVFVDEQEVPRELEFDDRDGEAVHASARVDGETVGTARMRTINPSSARIERVAVLERYRGRGIGRQLMGTLEGIAREEGLERTVVHAQVTAEAFYHSIGYETASEAFEEAGMDHVEMEKRFEGH